MPRFRTSAMREKYRTYIQNGGMGDGCVLCRKEPIHSFTHWHIVVNDFPYDGVAKVHHMILPKRHTEESGITDYERQELLEIKKSYLDDRYGFIIESTHHEKSIPEHFHLHLIVEAD